MMEIIASIISGLVSGIVGTVSKVFFFNRRNEELANTKKAYTKRRTLGSTHVDDGTDRPTEKPRKQVPQNKYWLIVVVAIVIIVMCLVFVINIIGKTKGGSDPGTETYTEETESKRMIKEMNVEKEDPEVYQGSFVEETETDEHGWEFTDISTDTYTVDADVKGVYGVTASDLHNDSKMYIEVFDGTGSKVDMGLGHQTISNEYGFSFSADEVGDFDVRVGETCKINLHGSAETPYKVYIWKPKDIVDLTDLNTSDYRIHDSMQFPNQENGYSLALDSDSVVNFKLDNLSENSFLELSVYAQNGADDRFWEEIDKQSFDAGNEDRISVELQGGEKYIVYVRNNMDTGVSPYTLSVIK